MNIEELLKEMDVEFMQKQDHYGYYGWLPETEYTTVRQWLAKKLQQALVIKSVCDHDRHYSEIDGFAYCDKCGEYMQ